MSDSPNTRTAFVTKAEATFRFGFVADAKDIPRLRRLGRPLPAKFTPAVRTRSGEIISAKYGERYHADIRLRVSEDCEEGYTYEASNTQTP